MVEENFEMVSIGFEPADEFVIRDLETLKVIADPMRLNIVESLHKPATVKEVAQHINRPPTKLYYHFNLLEKHELIQMVETRIVSGIVEKHYQAAARVYRIERGLLSPGSAEFDENIELTLASFLGDIQNDLKTSMREGVIDMSQDAPRHQRLLMGRSHLKLTPEEAETFYQRLTDLVDEYTHNDKKNTDDDGTQTYKVVMVLHPVVRSDDDDTDDSTESQL